MQSFGVAVLTLSTCVCKVTPKFFAGLSMSALKVSILAFESFIVRSVALEKMSARTSDVPFLYVTKLRLYNCRCIFFAVDKGLHKEPFK